MRIVARLAIADRARPAVVTVACACTLASAHVRQPAVDVPHEERVTYRLEAARGGAAWLRQRFDQSQLALLEKLNRADLEHLPRLSTIVVPEVWLADEAAYSPLPPFYRSADSYPKLLVVVQSHQVFGGYELGRLVRWGPLSSGRQSSQTPPGFFHLNWRSQGRHSTVDPEWFMKWYFNFDNALGLSLHEYALPGRPASHACIRLLERDAVWLFNWGDQWTLDARRHAVLDVGTPVFVVGRYDFTAPPPWRSLQPSVMAVQLPSAPQFE